MKKLSLILAITYLLSGCAIFDAVRESRTETIPKDRWVGMLGAAFSDATLKLNNYTEISGEFVSDPTYAFHKPADSFLTVSLPHGSVEWPLVLNPFRKEPSTIYINDINSENISFDARNRFYIIDIDFEDNEPEAKTNCVNNALCFAYGDRDVNIDSPKIRIAFRPSVENGELSYSSVNVSLETSSTNISGCSDDLFAFLCDLFFSDREGFIKDKVETQLEKTLLKPANKSALKTVINTYLRNIGVEYPFVLATINGNGDLVLTYRS